MLRRTLTSHRNLSLRHLSSSTSGATATKEAPTINVEEKEEEEEDTGPMDLMYVFCYFYIYFLFVLISFCPVDSSNTVCPVCIWNKNILCCFLIYVYAILLRERSLSCFPLLASPTFSLTFFFALCHPLFFLSPPLPTGNPKSLYKLWNVTSWDKRTPSVQLRLLWETDGGDSSSTRVSAQKSHQKIY